MMIVSMTGYGYSVVAENKVRITTEIKTVNHRYCEINVKLPKELSSIEEQVRRKVTHAVRRGKADVLIFVESTTVHNESIVVNWSLLEQYLQSFSQIKEKYKIETDFSITDLLNIPDVFEVKSENNVSDQLKNLVYKGVDRAVNDLYTMRKKEGQALQKDLINRLLSLGEYIYQIKKNAPDMITAYRNRLIKLINGVNEANIDEQRILTEVALYADRSNIDEELTRLESHLNQFDEFLKEHGIIGRKLDFLLQEMNREINTIGAKSNHIDISKKVVEIKSEIEKLREQVQNIE
jgi:uncharacterized protein (TIGR00255 family)